MAVKEKKAKKTRTHKESKGTARGAKPVKLSEVEKVLISSGGLAHRTLRRHQSTIAAPKSRKTRADKQAAR